MKAQIPLKFLIGLILAMMIFVPSAIWVSNLFRLSDKALDDFNSLVENIEEVRRSEIGTIESMPLIMDEDTAIVGFAKNKDQFQILTNYGTGFKFEKTEDQLLEKSYICLCRELDISAAVAPKCKKSMICDELDIDFADVEKSKGFVWQGFIIFRVKNPTHTYRNMGLEEIEAKTRSIYIEKTSHDSITICDELINGTCTPKII